MSPFGRQPLKKGPQTPFKNFQKRERREESQKKKDTQDAEAVDRVDCVLLLWEKCAVTAKKYANGGERFKKWRALFKVLFLKSSQKPSSAAEISSNIQGAAFFTGTAAEAFRTARHRRFFHQTGGAELSYAGV